MRLSFHLNSRQEPHPRKLAAHDQAIAGIRDAVRQLMAPSPASKRPIGFVTSNEK